MLLDACLLSKHAIFGKNSKDDKIVIVFSFQTVMMNMVRPLAFLLCTCAQPTVCFAHIATKTKPLCLEMLLQTDLLGSPACAFSST